MMKLRNFVAVACMASAVWSMSACSEEEMQGQKAQGVQTIVASVGGPETRTWVGDDEQEVLWSENDAFGVFYTKNEAQPSESKFLEYKIKAGEENKASGTFELQGDAAGYTMGTYAVYPYQASMTFSEGKLAMTMNGTNPLAHTKNSNGPMFAEIPEGEPDNIRFHHLAALLKVTLNQMPEGAKQLKVTASNIIAGDFTASLSEPEPELVAAQDNTAEANKSVTVTLPAYTKGESLTFYVPLPTGMYARLNVSLLGETDNIIYTRSWSDIDVKKADLLTAALDVVTIDATAPTDINSALAAAITAPVSEESTTNIALTGAINTETTATAAIEIPVIERSNASLAFTNLTSTAEKPLVLKAATGEGEPSAEAVNKVSVAVPEVEAAAAPSLTITMPKTTVTLGSINEKAVYNKVIAKTAANTIIVAAGVTVKELEIAGGNVEIYGTVEKLTISTDNAATEITVASGGAADIRTVVDADGKFKFTSTWDGTSAVKPAIASGMETYNIYTAAQLASFQLKVVPTESTGANLSATIDKNIKLYADIDLGNKPWVGMVLGENCLFEGVKHKEVAPVISNVLVTEHALTETSIYTPEACVGLFAVTKRNSQIKYITVDGFKSQDKGADAKWSGALVGYSYGTTLYEGCTAKNVTIQSEALMAYRIGGLIGFIGNAPGKEMDLTVEVKDCHAENVTIKGGFCLAGLVGSIQGGANRTFIGCTTSGVDLAIPKTSSALEGAWSGSTFYAPYKWWAGYMSLFVGEINMGGTVTFTSCEAKDAAFTSEKLTSFGYDDIADYSYGKDATQEAIDAAIAGAKHYKLADSQSKLLPACVDRGTVVVGDKTLVDGEDYNLFTKIQNQ